MWRLAVPRVFRKMARKSKDETIQTSWGSITLKRQGKMTAEDIRRWAPTSAVATALADRIGERIFSEHKLASGAPLPQALEISGGMKKGLTVKAMGNKARVTFTGSSQASGRNRNRKTGERTEFVSKKRATNALKARSSQRYVAEPILAPSLSEIEAVLSALRETIPQRLLEDAAQRPARKSRQGDRKVLSDLLRRLTR